MVTMTKTAIEEELRGYFLSYDAGVGKLGMDLGEWSVAKSSSEPSPGPAGELLATVRLGRFIRRALNALPRWQAGILEQCYADASTYQIPLNVDRMKPAAVFCARAKAKGRSERDKCALAVERAHTAYAAARERQKEEDLEEARAARRAGQYRRAAYLSRLTEDRLGREAWTDIERDAWLEELGLPREAAKGEAA